MMWSYNTKLRSRCISFVQYQVIILCPFIIALSIYVYENYESEITDKIAANVQFGANREKSFDCYFGDAHGVSKECLHAIHGIDLNDLRRRSHSKAEPFSYLSEYKNPCWLELLPLSYKEEYDKTPFCSYVKQELDELCHIYDVRLHEEERPWRLRCLPYFHLLGVTKSGTTDLFYSTKSHPQVHGPWVKEPMYWVRRRYSPGSRVTHGAYIRSIEFSEYVNMFDIAANAINRSLDNQDIIGDGSSYTFWEDNGWQNHPEHKGLKAPKYTAAMALYAVNPQTKLVLLLRNPTDRLYSAYTMYKKIGNSPEDFDKLVESTLQKYDECFSRENQRICVYNISLAHDTFPVTLRASLYSVYLKEWLRVFPLDQFLIIKSEDYYNSRMSVMHDVYEFLGLEQVDSNASTRIEIKKPAYNRHYSAMLNSTREKLDKYFEPFNNELEGMLNRIFWGS